MKYLQADPKTGILRYRRVFPVELRPHIRADGRSVSEYKVSLRSRRLDEPGAMELHAKAAAEYDEMIERARKRLVGHYDSLDEPLIKFLGEKYLHDELYLDEQARWGRALPEVLYSSRRDREADWEVSRELLGMMDQAGLVDYWRDWTLQFAQGLGYDLNPATEMFGKLCCAIGEAACRLWLELDRRFDGQLASTPMPPEQPRITLQAVPGGNLKSRSVGERPFGELAEGLMAGARGARIGGGVREHARSFLRVLREVKGSPTPSEMTRLLVSEVLDMMAQKPARLMGAERNLDLPTLVQLYSGRTDVPRMSGRTMDVRMSAMSTIWKSAVEDGLISTAMENPFVGRKFLKTPNSKKTANGFTADELRAYFSMPCFQIGDRPVRGRGEAIFWIPLLCLYTGARPEEVAQLLVDDIFVIDGHWAIRFTDKGLHPAKGRQTLKTEGYDSGERTISLPGALTELGLLDYIQHLKHAGEVALFPLLRRKNKRPGIYDSFGNWFSDYVYDAGVLQRGQGRKPVREFRDTWSTAARICRIPREAMQYIQGHKAEGSDATSDSYGEFGVHGRMTEMFRVVDKHRDEVDIVGLVPRWRLVRN